MVTGIFKKFISFENFWKAFQKVAAKNSAGGIDGISVEDYQKRAVQRINSLIQQIQNKTYVPKPVQSFHQPKFNEENEWRELGLPAISDKIVQAAMLQVVEPIAEKLFLDTSYGYRQGKGHYKALRRVEHNLTNGKCSWVANRDIDNFFDTLNHEILLKRFSELVDHDEHLVDLVALWCRMGIVDKTGKWHNVQAGVRQGQVISPLLANLYLHPLDEFATAHGWAWVRYADNYLIMRQSQSEAETADRTVTEFLAQKLSLRLNHAKDAITSLENGFDFLGVRFCCGTRSIAPDKIRKIEKKIEWCLSVKNKAGLESVLKKMEDMVQGWLRYYSFLNPIEEFNQIDAFIQKQLTNLAAKRIAQQQWDKNLPEALLLPKLLQHNDIAARSKALETIWRKAVELDESKQNSLKTADRKVSRQRQRYSRKHIAGGEVFVSSPGSFVGKQGAGIIVRKERRIVAEIPVIKLKSLTVAAHGIALSSDVINLCVEKNIPIHFVNSFGNICAVATSPGGASSDIAVLQIQKRDLPTGLTLARMFVYGKLKNQFSLLKYHGKYRKRNGNCYGALLAERRGSLSHLIRKAKNLPIGDDPERFRQQLMGVEGAFGARYWDLLKHILKDGISFTGRERRGARDLVNSLLNYGYGILYGRTLNAITCTGLNPTGSFLHTYQPGKPTLVYDLVEEFRAEVVDKSVFALLNRGNGFALDGNGLLNKVTRQRLTQAVLFRLGSEVKFCGKKLTLEEIIGRQAHNIKHHLSGKRQYRPFLSRW
jgi:group II intron reverse transcriptase/maturase/CRISPR-associated endonuclease Cas1